MPDCSSGLSESVFAPGESPGDAPHLYKWSPARAQGPRLQEGLMEPKKVYKAFRYESEVFWKSGHRAAVCSPGKPDVDVSSPPEFKGEPGVWTPEEMFVASINACTFMTFLAFARHKGLEFVGYESDAEGLLENVEGKYRFTEITLNPHVRIKSDEDLNRAREILDDAHTNCFLTQSLALPVKMFPQIHVG
jgi:organic hydroperoxide reductase OsmC/OhrA